VADAERHPPFLNTWDPFGRRRDELVTSAGWKGLQAVGIAEGMGAGGGEEEGDGDGEMGRVVQFLKYGWFALEGLVFGIHIFLFF